MKSRVKALSLLVTLMLSLTSNTYANPNCKRLDNDIKVLSWAYEAMLATTSYNFVNHDLNKASGYYTNSAWLDCKKELGLEKMIQKIVAEKMILTVGLKNSPLLLEKNANSWQVNLPLMLIYQNDKKTSSDYINLNIAIKKNQKVPDCLIIESIKRV